jgi:hypothetical protein
VRINGYLTQEAAAIVRAATNPLCAPRTMRRTGTPDNGADPSDVRSAPQRLHDALIEVCGHHSEWQIRINAKDGHPEFIPPAFVDPDRRPRRNTYHRRE